MKEERQRAIMDLVSKGPAKTQQDLAQALGKLGISATQATVSRDIQELGLVRTGEGYRARGVPLELVSSVELVEFLMIVRTPPGTAGLVARALDESGLEGVAGTVAGDDTILVVLRGRSHAAEVRRFLGA